FCRNDFDPSDRENSPKRFATGTAARWLTEHSALAFYLERVVWLARARFSSGPGAMPGAGSFEVVEAPYRQIAARARERRVPGVLIIFPTLDVLEGRAADDYSERLHRLGKELGWPVIDL